MARELRRLLIDPQRLRLSPGEVLLQEPEQHYLGRVLRCRRGDQVALVDGQGSLWTAVLTNESLLQLEQPLEAPLENQPAPWPWLELAMAPPKREVELVWRMATELGADRFQPLRAQRSQTGPRLPLERWRTIVAEAAEQCERLWLPALAEPLEALDWFDAVPQGPRLLATTRHGGLPQLAELLPCLLRQGETAGLSLAIGPEGGWSPQEEEAAQAGGWRLVSLGPSILRTSTAAVAAIAALAAWRSLSCASSPSPSP
jgi:16S rRNA (uracil1498-N3)-methyltransferase